MLARAALATILVALGATTAQSETYGVHGQVQHRFERLSDFALDADGTSHEQLYRHTFRTRVGGKMSFSRDFWISSTVQLLDGQVLGAESPIPNGPRAEQWRNGSIEDRVELRESTLQVPFGLGTFRIGRMPVHWGMGLVMHDGEQPDTPFDDPRGGDIVNGVAVTLTPMLLFGPGRMAHAAHLSFGGDIVEQDELSRRTDGDLAWRVWGAMTWEEPWLHGGFYVAARHLERENLDHAEHIILDTAWSYLKPLGEALRLNLEAEVAVVTGKSALTRSPGSPRHLEDILQVGAATRVTLEDVGRGASYGLEFGFASGDGDSDDDVNTAFRFDPARRVGMLLFDEVLSRMSARHYAARNEAGNSSATTWEEPTNGAVTNSLYFAPSLGWSLLGGTFDLRVGGVIGLAPEPLPQGDTSLPSSDVSMWLLGYELNTSAKVTVDIGDLLSLALGTQYGVFIAGEGLDDVTGSQEIGVVHKWRLLADVSF